MKIALANLFKRRDREQLTFEVEDELLFHVEMLERKYAQQGMSPAAAKAAALRRFGNLERVMKQCVDISRRNSLLRRVLKTSSILMALAGLAIHIGSSNFKVARIGDMLMMIAVSGRLLLYVHGLCPWTFFSHTDEIPLSVVTELREDSSKLREP
jgi:hypothetical protein